MGEPDLHAQHRAEQRERVVDVVAVADERDDEAPSRPNRSRIVNMSASAWQGCSRSVRPLITGMSPARRAPRRPRGGPSGRRSRRRTARGCGRRRGRSRGRRGRVLGQVDRVSAQLVHARLERHARPEARLLEQHRQRPPDERRVGVAAIGEVLRLQLRSEVEDPQTSSRPDPRRQQVAPAQRGRLLARHPLTLAATRQPRQSDAAPVTVSGPRVQRRGRRDRRSTRSRDCRRRG